MMGRSHMVWAVVKKEYREIMSKWTGLVYPITLLALFVLTTTMMGRVMIRADNMEAYKLISESALTNYLFAVFMLCMTPLLPFAFEKEKIAGTMESLLASPAGPCTIWIGKATFLFLWAYSFALVYLVVSAAIVYWQSQVLGLALPFTAGTLAFVLLSPVLCAAFALLVSEISMMYSPRLVSFFSGIAVVGFIMISSASMRSPAAASARLLAMVLTSVAVLIACGALAPMLTRERVLLGNK